MYEGVDEGAPGKTYVYLCSGKLSGVQESLAKMFGEDWVFSKWLGKDDTFRTWIVSPRKKEGTIYLVHIHYARLKEPRSLNNKIYSAACSITITVDSKR